MLIPLLITLCACLTGCFGSTAPLLPVLPDHVAAVFITLESPENVSGASECVQVGPGRVAIILHTEEIQKLGGEAAVLTALVTLASTCLPLGPLDDGLVGS